MHNNLLIALDTSTEAIAIGVAKDLGAAELGGDMRRSDCDGMCEGTDEGITECSNEGASAKNKQTMLDAILASDSIPARRCANERLLPCIQEMTQTIDISKEQVKTIVCGRGPGSFTGVRIGVATAKGMASGLECALYGVSTLDAIAWEAWIAGHRGRLGVIGDALRKEVYPVRYDLKDGGVVRLDCDNVDKPANTSVRWAASGEASGSLCEGLPAASALGASPESCASCASIPALSALPESSQSSSPASPTTNNAASSPQKIMIAGDGLLKFADIFQNEFERTGISVETLPQNLWNVTGRGLIFAYFDLVRRGKLGSGNPQELLPVYTRLSDAEENEKARQSEGKPMRGVLLNPVDFVEKSDTAGGLDPSSTNEVPQSGVALDEDTTFMQGGASSGGLEDANIDTEHPLILAIESSCDETAAAVVDGDKNIVADLIATQIDFHKRFGGVVPEIASRKHTEAIVGLIDETMEQAGNALGLSRALRWRDLDAIAVTQGPGLIGALVVGLAFAKGVSWATGLPLVGVNHLEGHIYANQLANPAIKPPMVVSLLSGGHTMLVHVKDWGNYEVLGQTLDDAVGEAYDKVAKALGLGYPGGPVISKYAAKGDPKAINFPRAMLHSHDYRFSLSGLKTSVMTYIKQEVDAGRQINIPDLAASFQRAVIDVQVAKAVSAVKQTGVSEFCLGGGVAANPELRQSLLEAMEEIGVNVTLPSLSACTDNAAMIAAVALDEYKAGKFIGIEADSIANMSL